MYYAYEVKKQKNFRVWITKKIIKKILKQNVNLKKETINKLLIII
jgi:hypothetical protein